ncbi:hypothetical protein BV22DRAFT_1044185 [Leucogyrophana mollusca]|uniref:Uncharacterized protein n=1 Tax=Leucogyrophana mollusca TaxID=85980 RepID=A0ACB8BU98_9AGAM|nr:hypothetical protein BV22DRAFT_1044185 [Leucogyrophana mollusca]
MATTPDSESSEAGYSGNDRKNRVMHTCPNNDRMMNHLNVNKCRLELLFEHPAHGRVDADHGSWHISYSEQLSTGQQSVWVTRAQIVFVAAGALEGSPDEHNPHASPHWYCRYGTPAANKLALGAAGVKATTGWPPGLTCNTGDDECVLERLGQKS